jgi:two-component system, OmpR family, response regulator
MISRAPRKMPDLANLTILVVDDDDDSLDLLDTLLTTCGVTALLARSAIEAFAHIDTTPTLDAIVTDLAMPHMDGVELVRKVRAHGTRHSVPVVALTGFYEKYPNAKEFDAYLRKPIDVEDLGRAIQSVTGR